MELSDASITTTCPEKIQQGEIDPDTLVNKPVR